MDIKTALTSLDPLDDANWTTDGAPRLDVLSARLGAPVTRQQVRAVAPEFSRNRFEFPAAAPAAPAAPAAAPAAPAADEGTDQAEPEPQAEPQAEPQPELNPAEARARWIDERCAKLRAQRDAIDTELGELAREQALLQPALDAKADRHADQKARMEYIEAEQRRKLARAEARAAATPSGVAPIDRSFGRRTGFGGRRPEYPVKPQA